MRGCACRGDSAGFVHIKCLTELAKSKEASDDRHDISRGWMFCGNCKQGFEDALGLEMMRRFWWHYRSSQDRNLLFSSTRSLANGLGYTGEIDIAGRLLDEASTCVGNNMTWLLDLRLIRIQMLVKHGQNLEALGFLQTTLPEAKLCTMNPHIYYRTMQQLADVLLKLDRYQEAHDMATEAVTYCKATYGLEHLDTLIARRTYSFACAKLGRVEEAKANFEDILTTQTRILSRDHPSTRYTWECIRECGFAEPSG